MALDVVSRLNCLQLLVDQLHNNNTEFHGVGGWCGPGHYVVTPTQVEVELSLSWAATISTFVWGTQSKDFMKLFETKA